jgi:hypothetical protein
LIYSSLSQYNKTVHEHVQYHQVLLFYFNTTMSHIDKIYFTALIDCTVINIIQFTSITHTLYHYLSQTLHGLVLVGYKCYRLLAKSLTCGWSFPHTGPKVLWAYQLTSYMYCVGIFAVPAPLSCVLGGTQS